MFLLPGATSYDTQYFTALTEQGRATVENHTVDHPDLTTLDAARAAGPKPAALMAHLKAAGLVP